MSNIRDRICFAILMATGFGAVDAYEVDTHAGIASAAHSQSVLAREPLNKSPAMWSD